jgi:glycosyltransferase involved in cell wall biosynthesis
VRVLYVIYSLSFGGAERRCSLLAAAAAADGHEVAVAPLHGSEGFACPAGVELLAPPPRADTKAQRARHLWRVMRAFRPDVYHGFVGPSDLGIVVARAAGVPVVVVSLVSSEPAHLALSRRERWQTRLGLAGADRGQANSEGVFRVYRDLFRVPEHKLTVIPNFIDCRSVPCRDTAARAAVRAELGLGEEHFAFAVVARLMGYKRHEDLLAAAARLIDRFPSAHWICIGDGPRRGELAGQAAALGLSERVHFLGSRADVPRLLQGMDGFILPSLYEGMPNVVLEAMAAGLPVIGTRVAGTEELVRPGLTGWLTPCRDPGALAQAMAELLADPVRGVAMGLAGRQVVASCYDLPVVTARFFDLYAELLRGRRRAVGGGVSNVPAEPRGEAP